MLKILTHPDSRTTPGRWLRRRGVTLVEITVIVISILGGGIATYFATPHLLKAGTTSGIDSNRQNLVELPEEARAAIDALNTLILKSTKTVELNKAASHPMDQMEFIALWLDDRVDPGHLNQAEIVVLRHSRMLQSITAYAVELSITDHDTGHGSERIGRQLHQPGFIDGFLRHPGVRSHVIGMKVIGWEVVGDGSSDHTAQSLPLSSPGWIELTCLAQTDDNSLIASVPTPLRPALRAR